MSEAATIINEDDVISENHSWHLATYIAIARAVGKMQDFVVQFSFLLGQKTTLWCLAQSKPILAKTQQTRLRR